MKDKVLLTVSSRKDIAKNNSRVFNGEIFIILNRSSILYSLEENILPFNGVGKPEAKLTLRLKKYLRSFQFANLSLTSFFKESLRIPWLQLASPADYRILLSKYQLTIMKQLIM